MFEHVQYSFGFATLKVASLYVFYINIGFLLFGCVGWLVERITQINIPSVGKILVGYVAYTAMAWWLYRAGHSSIIGMTFTSLALGCVAAYAFVTLYPHGFMRGAVISCFGDALRRLTPLLVIQAVLILFWSGFLNDKPYHILSFGNNDLYFWGFMADHVMGISNIERINFGEGGSNLLSQVIDCFGVYGWLGLVGKMSMKSHSIEAAMLFQLSLLILSTWLVYEISTTVVGVRRVAAFVPAFVFSFNPLWLYIFTNNFLSQMTATFCLFGFIFIIGSSTGHMTSKRSDVFWGFVFCLSFLFAYPGLLLPYIAFTVAAIGVFNFYVYRVLDNNPWKAVTRAVVGFIIGGLIGVAFFPEMTLHALNRFVTLSGIGAGWPLSMLDPFNMIGLISYALDGTIFSNWFVYCLLVLAISAVFIKRNFSPRMRSLSESRYDSLLLLSIIALVGYLGVYFIKGVSYQQWKFATYFPLPLLLLVVVNYFAPKRDV